MVRKTSGDIRVVKSQRDIKRATLELMAEKPFSSVRVEDIVKRAPVNMKTFYKYFPSKPDVLTAICDDIVDELEQKLSGLDPSDLKGAILLLYRQLSTDDPAKKKLFSDDAYKEYFRKMVRKYFSLDFFMAFAPDEVTRAFLPGYFSSAVSIYRQWKAQREDRTPDSVEELAGVVSELFTGGLHSHVAAGN